MQVTVFYEDWQMDCCGDPFAIGDVVDWSCRLPNAGEREMIDCDYWYEAHLDSEFDIVGEIVEIYRIDFERKNGENDLPLLAAYQKTPIQSVQHSMSANGFLVTLSNAKIEKDQ